MEQCKDDNVEEHYQHLLADLWHKGFQLKSRQDGRSQSEDEAVSSECLEDFFGRMATIRDELNAVKSKVHAMVTSNMGRNGGGEDTLARWRSFTSFTHPLRQLPRRLLAKCADQGLQAGPSLCTQAYCKFLQIAAAHPALLEVPEGENEAMEGLRLDGGGREQRKTLRSLHLCEAPGAFVLGLKHLLAGKGIHLDWHMNSLTEFPSTSSTMDDQLIRANPERMALGWDGTGDIFQWDERYSDKLKTDSGGAFHLVTGDGGIDCTDEPQEQEGRTLPLVRQQFQVATQCLCRGGNLLLKAYTFFEPQTVALLAEICTNFEAVHCLKPPSSKPGNSEVYLLCLNFLGLQQPPPMEQPILTAEFLRRIEQCARLFADHQMRFIQFNLRTFRRLSQGERSKLEMHKCAVQGVLMEFLWQLIQPGLLAEQAGDEEEGRRKADENGLTIEARTQ